MSTSKTLLVAKFDKHSMPKDMSDPIRITATDFQELFLVWNRKIYHYAFRKTSSTFIAEETVQRVFIKLWHNLHHKQVDISIEAQLFCISKSVLIDILKEERRRHMAALSSDDIVAHEETPLEVFRLKEVELQLNQVIDQMPKARREVFRMSRFENLSYKEIAQRLSISPKTVENHIALALRTVRRAFHYFLSYLSIIFIFF